MMKNAKKVDLKEFAEMMGVNYYVVQVKGELIDKIKAECKAKNISQRELARIVPGLTHDRISKIFNGQLGHMSIDKLIEILNYLNIRINLSFKKAA